MGTGSLAPTYRDNPKFRHIICFLKHGGEKLHAIWLAKKMGGFADLMEAKKWVEELSHPEPISMEGWINRDKSSPNHCGEQVRSNEAHTCPQQEEEKTPWAIFDEGTHPTIQRIDEEAEDGQTDDTAAICFVRELEQGTPDALAAAEAFIKFHGRL
jgi:hypothetical protein